LSPAWASGVTSANLQEVVVSAQRIVLMGDPRAASEGTVLHEQLENRPLLRTSELLEVVPGLIVTQHTGDGGATEASRPSRRHGVELGLYARQGTGSSSMRTLPGPSRAFATTSRPGTEFLAQSNAWLRLA